jgi:hypothetical protein
LELDPDPAPPAAPPLFAPLTAVEFPEVELPDEPPDPLAAPPLAPPADSPLLSLLEAVDVAYETS